jgi:glycosyltransferase involved in cell wall biosynthesis
MKILTVHDTLGSFGGAETNVLATAGALMARGHTVGLLAARASGKGEDAWHDLFRDNLFWMGNQSPVGVARRFEADLIYMHKCESLPCIEALLKSGIPMVRMVHDHDIHCLRSYRYNPLTRKICTRPAGAHCVVPCMAPLKRNRAGGLPFIWTSFAEKQKELALSREFDRNIVATEFMKKELLINGFDGCRIEICAPVPRPVEPLTSNFSDRNLMVFAGQIIRGKGVDILLRALARVRVQFEAVILGDGNHRTYCEKLCTKLGLEKLVTFKGFVPRRSFSNITARPPWCSPLPSGRSQWASWASRQCETGCPWSPLMPAASATGLPTVRTASWSRGWISSSSPAN